MRYRGNGGLIGPVVTTNTSVAAGVWAMPDFQQRLGNSTWPTDQTQSLLSEPYFEYNTLLMKAVGANTTQNYTFTDSSTTATALTRNGDVTQGAFSPYSYPDGRWAAYFDGTGDYFTAGSSVSLSGDFTVEGWVYINSRTTEIFMYGLGNDLNPTAATFFVATTGYLRVYTNNSHLLSGTSVAVGLNQWTHIAFVRSSNVLRAYINGVLVDTSSTWSNTLSGVSYINAELNGNAQTVYVGGSCYISNLRVVTSAVYTSAFTTPSTPLTAISGTSLLVCQSNRFKDNSSNAYSITRNGDTKISPFGPFNPDSAYSASTTGGSMFFDGTGDFLTASYSTTNFDWWTNDFTLEAWVYPTTLTNWSYNDGTGNRVCMFGNMNNADGVDYWSFGPAADGTVKLYYYNGSAIYNLTSTATVLTNQWNHIAVTRTSSGVVIFVNGVASSTLTVSGTPQSGAGTPLTLGRHNGYAITGYVSDLRLTKGSALYSGNFTPPTAPLTAGPNTKLLLNGTNAGIIDASRKNNLYTFGNAQVRTNVVKYDKSMYFDGSGDYVTVPANPMFNFNTGNFTIEFWLNYTLTTGIQTIFDVNYGTAPNVVFQPVNGTMTVYINGTATSLTGSADTAGVWYHYALVRNGTTVTLYRNGTSVSSATFSGNVGNATVPVYIGGSTNGGGYYFNGHLEDVRITNGYARYTSNFTPPTTQLTTL